MSIKVSALKSRFRKFYDGEALVSLIEKIAIGYHAVYFISWSGLAINRRFEGLTSIEFYLPILSLLFVFWSLYKRPLMARNEGSSSWELYSFIIGIGVLVFILNLPRLNSLGIWYDEVAQGIDSLRIWPVEACSISSQPPFDCFWQKLFQTLLGQSVLGLRFGTLIWFSLSVAFFGLLSLALSGNILVSIAAVSAFILNPSVYHYAIEARPVSLALFTGLLFLGYLVLYLRYFKGVRKQQIYLAILYCQFTLSIGMQPIFLGFCLFLSFVFGAFLFSSIRARLKSAAVAIAAGLLVSLPIQIFTIHVQRSTTFGGTKFDFYKMIPAMVAKIEFLNIINLLFWPSSLVIGAVVLLALALGSSFRKSCFGELAKASLLLTQSSLMFLFVFPILFSSLLSNFFFQIRYLITGFIFIWISFVFLASSFANKKFVSFVSVILILDLVVSGRCSEFPGSQMLKRQNLSEVYDWISKNTSEQDLMVSTCIYQNASEICYATRAGMLESKYYSTIGKARVQSGPSPFSRLSDVILKEQAFGKLFLVFETQSSMSFNPSINRLKEQKLVPILNIGETLVAVFDGGPEKFRSQWFGFFEFVQSITPSQNCTSMEVKLQRYLFEKKHSEFVGLKADWFKKCIESPVLFQMPYYNDLEQRVWGADK